MKRAVYRQGEVCFVKVDNVPGGLAATRKNKIVLGHGESGNAHLLTGNVSWLHQATEDIDKLLKDGATGTRNDVYVVVEDEPAQVSHTDQHEQHRGFAIEPGTYLITIDTECQWWTNEVARLAD